MFKYKTILFVVILVLGFVLLSQAQAAISDLNPSGISTGGSLVTTLQKIIGYAIRAILVVTGSFMVVYVIYGGLLLLTSAGNDERITKGRTTLTWSIIGVIVIVTSYASVSFLFGTAPTGGGSLTEAGGTPNDSSEGTNQCIQQAGTDTTLQKYNTCISLTVIKDPDDYTNNYCKNDMTCNIGSALNAGRCCVATMGESGAILEAYDIGPLDVIENTGAAYAVNKINIETMGRVKAVETGTKIDWASLTISETTSPNKGTATIADRIVQYTPNLSAFGENIWSYTICNDKATPAPDCLTKKIVLNITTGSGLKDPTCTAMAIQAEDAATPMSLQIYKAAGGGIDDANATQNNTGFKLIPPDQNISDGAGIIGQISYQSSTAELLFKPCNGCTVATGISRSTTIKYTYTDINGKSCPETDLVITTLAKPSSGGICTNTLINTCSEYKYKDGWYDACSESYPKYSTTTCTSASASGSSYICCNCAQPETKVKNKATDTSTTTTFTPPLGSVDWTSWTCLDTGYVITKDGVIIESKYIPYPVIKGSFANVTCGISDSLSSAKLDTYTELKNCYSKDNKYCHGLHCGNAKNTLCCNVCVKAGNCPN